MKSKVIAILAVVGLLLTWKAFTQLARKDTQLSEKPPVRFSGVALEPEVSTLGLQTIIPFSSIQQSIEKVMDTDQSGTGERQNCRKIAAINVCATIQWQYQLNRSGPVLLKNQNNHLFMSIPVAITGQLSVDGRGGKILGLRNKNFYGHLEINTELNINLTKDWCPRLHSKLSYRWISDPKVHLTKRININLRKTANKALNKKIAQVEHKLAELVDCQVFRKVISDQWHTHYLPIEIATNNQAHLKVVPQQAALGRTRIEEDHLSFAIELLATTEMVQQAALPEPQELPPLRDQIAADGNVEFSLLLKLPYGELINLVSEKIDNKASVTGGRQITLTLLDLYPSGNQLVFDVGFQISGPAILGGLFGTTGRVYLRANPQVDSESSRITFENLEFTRIIDNQVWALMSAAFHQKILAAIKNNAVITLDRQLRKLESAIAGTLGDHAKTGGISIDASAPAVRLINLNPEATALAAVVHVSTRLQAILPTEVLLRDHVSSKP